MIFSEKWLDQLRSVAALGGKSAFLIKPDKAREACNVCYHDRG